MATQQDWLDTAKGFAKLLDGLASLHSVATFSHPVAAPTVRCRHERRYVVAGQQRYLLPVLVSGLLGDNF